MLLFMVFVMQARRVLFPLFCIGVIDVCLSDIWIVAVLLNNTDLRIVRMIYND